MTLTVIYWGCLYSSPKLHSTFAVCNIFPINTLNGWCENFVRYLPALGVFFKLRGLRNSSVFYASGITGYSGAVGVVIDRSTCGPSLHTSQPVISLSGRVQLFTE